MSLLPVELISLPVALLLVDLLPVGVIELPVD